MPLGEGMPSTSTSSLFGSIVLPVIVNRETRFAQPAASLRV
jgi:hypothetical protein